MSDVTRVLDGEELGVGRAAVSPGRGSIRSKRAPRARIELAFGDAAVQLTVTNPVVADGGTRSGGGHGLIGMRERDAWDVKTGRSGPLAPDSRNRPLEIAFPDRSAGRQHATPSPASGERLLQVVNA
ncbi:MAG TPA: hypothetical protein VFF07_09795 [Actinomycetota bacterium]|nr:hypothetical protein [Actinomycetota bacterium]